MTTIREMINQYRDKLKDASTLTPTTASEILIELTSLIGNLNSELIERQYKYNLKKQECLEEIKSVAKAEVKAQTSEEWKQYQEIKGYLEMTKEMIRGIKYYLRSSEDEFSLNRNL